MTKSEKRLEESTRKAEKLGVFIELKKIHQGMHKRLK